MSWLYEYLKNRPLEDVPESLATKDQLAQFLRTKSSETSLEIYAISYQAEALMLLSKGGQLSKALDCILKSLYISMIANSKILSKYVHFSQAALWQRCGNEVLSDVYLEFCVDDDNVNLMDYLKAACLRSHMLYDKGMKEESLTIMESLRHYSEKSISFQRILLPNSLLLHFNISLDEGRIMQARIILSKLSRIPDLGTEYSEQVTVARVKLDMYLSNYSQALEKIYNGVERVVRYQLDVCDQIHYMLLQIRILCQTSQPVRALSITTRCIQMAEKASLLVVALEATILMSQVLNSLDEFNDSMKLLTYSMPKILETENINLIGEAYETFSYSLLGQARNNMHSLDVNLLTRAKHYLGISRHCKYIVYVN
jgi:anaphase-promoting complex subunit 5